MEAIVHKSLMLLAGACLGLMAAVALNAYGMLNGTAGGIAAILFAVGVWFLVPDAPAADLNLSSADPTSGHATHLAGNDERLDEWVSNVAARGRSLTPTSALAGCATRQLGQRVCQGRLRDAIERFHARGSVERMHRTRRLLARP